MLLYVMYTSNCFRCVADSFIFVLRSKYRKAFLNIIIEEGHLLSTCAGEDYLCIQLTMFLISVRF